MSNYIWIACLVSSLCLSSCVVVKPYEKVYLNDIDMQLNGQGKNFENYVQSIREGATPTSGAKSSGGCGCN